MNKFNVKISVIDPDYDAQIEKDWGWLNHSYENQKYQSETGFMIDNLKEYKYITDIELELPFEIDGNPKTFTFTNMSVLELTNNDDSIFKFIISKSLISSTRELHREKNKAGYFYFYLKPDIEYLVLNKSLYVVKSEIPQDLKLLIS